MPLSLEEYALQEKYCGECFLSYNGDMSINILSIMPSLCIYGVMDVILSNKFHSDLFIFLGFLCSISFPEHLSVIYNNKNNGSLPYILFIAV